MPDPTASVCRSCKGTKRRNHYLCTTCWPQLPKATRDALYIRDARAFRRLSDLHEQLRAGVPLTEIEITDE